MKIKLVIASGLTLVVAISLAAYAALGTGTITCPITGEKIPPCCCPLN